MENEIINNQPDQNTQPPIPDKTRLFTKKRVLILASVVFAIVIAFGIFTYHKKAIDAEKSTYQNNAYSKYIKNDLEEAETLAKKGLQKFPDDTYLLKTAIDARSEIGNKTGKEKEAFELNKQYIDKAKEKGQNDSEIMITLGYAHETAEKYEEALSYYEKALQLRPTASAYFHNGHVLKFLNRNKEANGYIKKAYDLEPNNGYFQLAYGNILLENGFENNALELFLKSATNKNSSNPQRSEAYVATALVYLQNVKLNEALDTTKKAMDLDPSNSMATSLYGFTLILLDQPTKGYPYVEKASVQNPRIVLNYMIKGLFLRIVGFYEDAIKMQQFGIDNIANDNTLLGDSQKRKVLGLMYYELAQTYSMTSNTDDSIKNLKLAIQNNPLIKGSISKSLQQGYFTDIKEDSEFISLL